MAFRTLETRAAARCRDLHQDANLHAEVDALLADGAPLPPWLGCWAMAARLAGDADSALTFAQAAAAEFACWRDLDGHARAIAEAAIAAYLLGRFAWGLAETRTCPAPADPSCAAALYLADFLNHLGLDEVEAASEAGERGLCALEQERLTARRAAWEIVLRRNLAAAYHFRGDLPAAPGAGRGAAARRPAAAQPVPLQLDAVRIGAAAGAGRRPGGGAVNPAPRPGAGGA
jgi:hypothetical protein